MSITITVPVYLGPGPTRPRDRAGRELGSVLGSVLLGLAAELVPGGAVLAAIVPPLVRLAVTAVAEERAPSPEGAGPDAASSEGEGGGDGPRDLRPEA